MYYFNIFFIYSFIGYIFEKFILHSRSGILHGPITPIYGVGVIIMIIVSRFFFEKLKLPRFFEAIISAFIIMLILTLLEYLTGTMIEKISGIVFWDYSKIPLNFGKYIAIPISACWFACSFLVIYFVKDLIDNFTTKIPPFITLLLIGTLIIDIIYTVIVGIDK